MRIKVLNVLKLQYYKISVVSNTADKACKYVAQPKRFQVNETITPETSSELITTANQIPPFHSAIPIFNLIGRLWLLDSNMCFSV